MKHPFCIVLCLVLLLPMFTACDPAHTQYDYNELADHVVSVELIEYENDDREKFSSWVPNQLDEIKSFDPDKVTVLETLDGERMPDFFDQLTYESILEDYYVYDSPDGICLRMTYQNGDFTVITADYANSSFLGFICRYSADGKPIDYVGSFSSLSSFTDLVNNFFEEQI